MFKVVCQVAFFEHVLRILLNLCENTAACGLLALNIVKKMNLGISEGWETPGQNSSPTLAVVKHYLSQVYLLIRYIGQTFLSGTEDFQLLQ